MSDTLPLAAKGRNAPPPVLNGPQQAVSVAVQSWPGVIAATHWHLDRPEEVNGADFYVGDKELGHIHLDGDVHLATSSALREVLVTHRLARPFPYYRSWVETSIRSEDKAQHAEWLFRLNYERLQGTSNDGLSAAIMLYATQRY